MRGSLFTVIIGPQSGFVNHKNIVKVRLMTSDVLFLLNVARVPGSVPVLASPRRGEVSRSDGEGPQDGRENPFSPSVRTGR